MFPTAEELLPLVNRAVVLHRMFVEDGDDDDSDPDYNAVLPVAYGEIWEINL